MLHASTQSSLGMADLKSELTCGGCRGMHMCHRATTMR